MGCELVNSSQCHQQYRITVGTSYRVSFTLWCELKKEPWKPGTLKSVLPVKLKLYKRASKNEITEIFAQSQCNSRFVIKVKYLFKKDPLAYSGPQKTLILRITHRLFILTLFCATFCDLIRKKEFGRNIQNKFQKRQSCIEVQEGPSGPT